MEKSQKDERGGDKLTTMIQSVTDPHIKIVSKEYLIMKSLLYNQFEKKYDP